MFIANCIKGVLYATMLHSEHSKPLLDSALDAFLATLAEPRPALLYKLYYEQRAEVHEKSPESIEASLDLAFNDIILDDVEATWKTVMGDEVDPTTFMRFEDREGMSNDDDGIDEGY